jgi:hypothetical protein
MGQLNIVSGEYLARDVLLQQLQLLEELLSCFLIEEEMNLANAVC